MTGVGFMLLKVLAVVSGDARVVSEGIHSLGFVFGWLVYFLIGKPTDLQRRREDRFSIRSPSGCSGLS